MDKEHVAVNIRVPHDMSEQLRADAAENDRSVAATVRRIIRLHLDRKQSEPKA